MQRSRGGGGAVMLRISVVLEEPRRRSRVETILADAAVLLVVDARGRVTAHPYLLDRAGAQRAAVLAATDLLPEEQRR